MIKNRYKVFSVFLASMLALTGCSSGTVSAEQTAITINGEKVSAGTYGSFLRYYQSQSYSYYERMYPMFGMEVPEVIWGEEYTAAVDEADEAAEEIKESAGTPVSTPGEQITESPETEVNEEPETYEIVLETEKALTYGDNLKNEVIEDIVRMSAATSHMEDYGFSMDTYEADIAKAAKEFIEENDAKILKKNGITEDGVKQLLTLMTGSELVEHHLTDIAEVTVTDEEAQMSGISYAVFSAANFEPQETEETTPAVEAETEAVSEAGEESVAEESLLEESSTEAISEEETETETEAVNYSAIAQEAATSALEEIKAGDETDDGFVSGILSGKASSIYLNTDAFATNSETNETSIPDEVIDAAKTLEEGKFYESVVYASDGNYYLVRLNSKTDAQATESRREELTDTKKSEYASNMIDKWASESTVEINKKVIDKFTVSDSEIYKQFEEPVEETTENIVEVEAETESVVEFVETEKITE